MDERAVKARRRYQKEWRQRNRDKIRQAQERFWMRIATKEEEEEQNAAGAGKK